MPTGPSGDVTQLLRHWLRGDARALSTLVPVMHRELRRLAHYHLKSERADHTLQSTALVNEAFLRLLGSQPVELRNRSHFIAVASGLMRQILVDYARSRGASKRDGGYRVQLWTSWPPCRAPRTRNWSPWTRHSMSCPASMHGRQESSK